MLYVNRLLNKIRLSPSLILQSDYFHLIAPTPETRYQALALILENSLIEYERFDMWIRHQSINVSGSSYVFSNIITDIEDTTYPVPDTILYCKSGSLTYTSNPWYMSYGLVSMDYSTSISARSWNYVKPVLNIQYSGGLFVVTNTHRPFYFQATNDFRFSEDSRIYGLDISNIHFYNVVLKNVLSHIRSLRESISVNTSVQFLTNIDNDIQKLESEIENYQRSNAKAMTHWRK